MCPTPIELGVGAPLKRLFYKAVCIPWHSTLQAYTATYAIDGNLKPLYTPLSLV